MPPYSFVFTLEEFDRELVILIQAMAEVSLLLASACFGMALTPAQISFWMARAPADYPSCSAGSRDYVDTQTIVNPDENKLCATESVR